MLIKASYTIVYLSVCSRLFSVGDKFVFVEIKRVLLQTHYCDRGQRLAQKVERSGSRKTLALNDCA